MVSPTNAPYSPLLKFIACCPLPAQLLCPAPVVTVHCSCAHPSLQVISPRNHMVFTPLLTSTCVGTIEPRSVAIPVVRIQKALTEAHNYYYS